MSIFERNNIFLPKLHNSRYNFCMLGGPVFCQTAWEKTQIWAFFILSQLQAHAVSALSALMLFIPTHCSLHISREWKLLLSLIRRNPALTWIHTFLMNSCCHVLLQLVCSNSSLILGFANSPTEWHLYRLLHVFCISDGAKLILDSSYKDSQIRGQV